MVKLRVVKGVSYAQAEPSRAELLCGKVRHECECDVCGFGLCNDMMRWWWGWGVGVGWVFPLEQFERSGYKSSRAFKHTNWKSNPRFRVFLVPPSSYVHKSWKSRPP